MRNARKFDEKITIGGVPTEEDLEQLKELGYKTLVDVRDEQEKFGGLVKRRAEELGLRYASIPISREDIAVQDLTRFYKAVFDEEGSPVYTFSRFGKRPLALLLLLEAVAFNVPVHRVLRRASEFGLGLHGDGWLQEFLVRVINEGQTGPLLESIRAIRMERLEAMVVAQARAGKSTAPLVGQDAIRECLQEAAIEWSEQRNPHELRRRLAEILAHIESD